MGAWKAEAIVGRVECVEGVEALYVVLEDDFWYRVWLMELIWSKALVMVFR